MCSDTSVGENEVGLAGCIQPAHDGRAGMSSMVGHVDAARYRGQVHGIGILKK